MKNLIFKNLYDTEYLQNLDKEFLLYLKDIDDSLHDYLVSQRQKYPNFAPSYGVEDIELIECAKILEIFLAKLFNIALESLDTQAFEFKKNFVNKRVKLIDISQYNFADIKAQLNITKFDEDTFIETVNGWLETEEKYAHEIELAAIFGAFLFFDRTLYEAHGCPSIFFKSQKRDFNALIPIKRIDSEVFKDDNSRPITRNDFNLYLNTTSKQALHNSNYCVKCHKRGKDYCRTGEIGEDSSYVKNPLGKDLTGCPLCMNISQMHTLVETGNSIAALAVATINNPLLAATGANICNDCTIACIFQKQEAVDTPTVETQTLKQVLHLPYGFEIYSLLARWNPLRFYRPYPLKPKNKNILVVGLGPAGFSLAYNMAMEGYGVVAVDALKLEPLEDDFQPIVNYESIVENLDDRLIQGFGGVAEYGITSRWDKNYLKVLRLILQRNSLIKMYGGIRFGSNLDFASAQSLGFSHIALATGAGKPNMLNLPNGMMKGIKTSSEFLMTLNMGAYKKDNLFNMQIRLPLVVLGGGLTALDCASEAIVYYKRMVEKIAAQYTDGVENTLNPEESALLQEYLYHYELFQKHSTIDVINQLGGVKIIYHKAFEASKAYKNNAEETHKALRQGVSFIENANLVRINGDNELTSLDFKINDKTVNIPAKTLILALGTNPNNILMEEYPEIFCDGLEKLNTSSVILQKLSTSQGDIAISVLGDTHKKFNGSVAKAMASGFLGYAEIAASMGENNIEATFATLVANFENAALSHITDIKEIAENIFEISIKSPLMAEKFHAGQFFKIQNLHSAATLLAEPVMLTGVSANDNVIKCIVLKTGVSTDIITKLKVGENIVFMGPLGEATKIPHNKKIMVIGGGVANATVLTIAQQAKAQGCEVIYVGGYKSERDIFYLDLIKKVSSKIFLSVENLAESVRDDYINNIKGNILQALTIAMQKDITNIFVAGSSGMMSAVKGYFENSAHQAIASMNSPMNCGLGGVCASCLSYKVDGTLFYACSQQEINIKEIDFLQLKQRLSQNSLSEKISYLFYKNLLNN